MVSILCNTISCIYNKFDVEYTNKTICAKNVINIINSYCNSYIPRKYKLKKMYKL